MSIVLVYGCVDKLLITADDRLKTLMNISLKNAVVFIFLALSVGGCAIDGTIDISDYRPSKTSKVEDYKVGVDDIIQVNVWRNPDLNVSVPVRPDGKISVPLVGDVEAGGKTTTRIAQSIEKELKTYIRDPNVTVIITNLRSHEYLNRIRVTGAVRQQISLTFRQGMTVIDAILAAGGLNEFAAANSTVLYRKEKNKTYLLNILLGDILHEGELSTNIELRPGDILAVQERIF